MAKRKRTMNDLQNTTQKTNIEQHEPYKKPGVNLNLVGKRLVLAWAYGQLMFGCHKSNRM
jgi:hypothetical protein